MCFKVPCSNVHGTRRATPFSLRTSLELVPLEQPEHWCKEATGVPTVVSPTLKIACGSLLCLLVSDLCKWLNRYEYFEVLCGHSPCLGVLRMPAYGDNNAERVEVCICILHVRVSLLLQVSRVTNDWWRSKEGRPWMVWTQIEGSALSQNYPCCFSPFTACVHKLKLFALLSVCMVAMIMYIVSISVMCFVV